MAPSIENFWKYEFLWLRFIEKWSAICKKFPEMDPNSFNQNFPQSPLGNFEYYVIYSQIQNLKKVQNIQTKLRILITDGKREDLG